MVVLDTHERTLFERELEELINNHCKENESNTPDFILAQYLNSCLEMFNTAIQQRENWYGRDPRPTSLGEPVGYVPPRS